MAPDRAATGGTSSQSTAFLPLAQVLEEECGYIGAWLTAWIHRVGDDVQKVAGELASLTPRAKLDPEPGPISHLREFRNFLSPGGGLMAPDAWTLLGPILRNMILIWLVLVPLLAAALMLPRLYLSLLLWVNTAGASFR